MSDYPKDDLFEDSKMSFGQHLDELRGALMRSVIGLLIGFLIGLGLANSVVKWIEAPLRSAMEDYYIESAVTEFSKEYNKELPEEIVGFMHKNAVTFEEVYLETSEINRIVAESAEVDPAEKVGIQERTLPYPESQMVRIRMWRAIRANLAALNAQEAFMIWLKAAFITGLMIASPYMFWQIWIFVGAGLYPHEKQYVYMFLPISLILFWSGAALAFFFVFEPVLSFLFSFNRAMDIDPDPRISEWISFVMFLPLGFGLAFQLPLVMLFINRIGILSIEQYVERWRIAILVIFVISMLLTPADPISMLLMAAPLTILYFLGIGMCVWMPRGRNPFDEGYDPT